MKPAKFAYHRADCAADALEKLIGYGDEARVLAGGQSLVPLLNFRVARPTALVDLNRCRDLDYITATADHIAIGTMTRQRTAELHPLLLEECPLIAKALHFAGTPTIRHRGTFGGSIAHGDPASELPAVAAVLEAEMRIVGGDGERLVKAADFFLAELTTAVEPCQMLSEIRIPRRNPSSFQWFGESGNHAGGMTFVGAAALVEIGEDGRIARARFAVHGVTAVPLRLTVLEQEAIGGRLDAARVAEAVAADLAGIDVQSGIHDEPEHRRALTTVLLEDAFRQLDAEIEAAGSA